MTNQTPLVFHESYGDVTRAQLAAYRKLNIPPAMHNDLEDIFGDDRAGIVKAIKQIAAENDGRVDYSDVWKLRR